MFSHEKLQVYQRALRVTNLLGVAASTWRRRHAFAGQLMRASDSMVLNLVEAARARGGERKLLSLDYSLGSTLECAACCDVAAIKALSPAEMLVDAKRELSEVAGMLMGLRKSWQRPQLQEESECYESQTSHGLEFAHERLDVYRLALGIITWLTRIPEATAWPIAVFRQLDESLTAIPLNLAEGNGRFARLQQRSFIAMANRRAFQAAARLDLLVGRGRLPGATAETGKEMLRAVAKMTHAMARGVLDEVLDEDIQPHDGVPP